MSPTRKPGRITKKIDILGVLGIIALVLGVSMIIYGNHNAPPNSYPVPENSKTLNSLVIKDQVAGITVIVNSAILDVPGFVAIRDSSGNILGTSPLLAPGENSSVFVTARIIKGNIYYGTIYADNGNGKFSNSDAELKDASGNVVSASFKAL